MDNGNLSGRFPAVVKSYDAKTRTCRVDIPAINNGGNVFPVSEIEYPIGDRSKMTEIEILEGDLVWVDFIGGDSRYPIITGWRNPRTENAIDWRKWHHKNIELSADETLIIQAKKIQIKGDIELSGGKLTHDGTNISKTHTHGGVKAGGDKTSKPQ